MTRVYDLYGDCPTNIIIIVSTAKAKGFRKVRIGSGVAYSGCNAGDSREMTFTALRTLRRHFGPGQLNLWFKIEERKPNGQH